MNLIVLSPLLYILGAGLFVLLLPYVVGPLLIRRTLKLSAEPRLIPFALDHPSLPPEVARDFDTVTEQLRPAGFEPVAGLALPGQVPNVRSILLLLANRTARDAALVSAMYTENA